MLVIDGLGRPSYRGFMRLRCTKTASDSYFRGHSELND